MLFTTAIAFHIPGALTEDGGSHALYLVVPWLLVNAGAWRRSWPSLVRRGLVLGGIVLGFASTLFAVGFSLPNGFVAAALLAILAALFLPRNVAWMLWAATLAAAALAGYAFASGWEHPPGSIFDLRSPANWSRVLIIYAGMSAAATAGLLRLTSRLRQAEAQTRSVLAALEQESARRLASLSEQRSLEAQLRECQHGEAVGALAGSVAHDFNNLLTVVLACSDELSLEPGRPELQRAAQDIQRAGERAAELTRELLLFSRTQTAAHVIIEVADVLHKTARLLERTLPAHIQLTIDAAPGLPAIETSATCVEQVLLNLCVNAADAMPAGGTLRVAASVKCARAPGSSSHQDYLCFEVTDTGTGMSAQVEQRAFEPLFSTKDAATHPGLGLAVVRRLLEESGGFAQLCSHEGRGTTVEAFWPITSRPKSSEPSVARLADATEPGATERSLAKPRAPTLPRTSSRQEPQRSRHYGTSHAVGIAQ